MFNHHQQSQKKARNIHSTFMCVPHRQPPSAILPLESAYRVLQGLVEDLQKIQMIRGLDLSEQNIGDDAREPILLGEENGADSTGECAEHEQVASNMASIGLRLGTVWYSRQEPLY